MVGVDLSVCQ